MDVAFVVNPENFKLTFARNSDGDFYLDTRSVYPVIATVCAAKGKWFHDASVGTYLSTIARDGRATGTRLTAAASDGLDQVAQDGLIRNGATVEVARLRPGAWGLTLRWTTSLGEQRTALKL